MEQSHPPDETGPRHAELSEELAQYAREQLAAIPNLREVLAEFGEDLETGQSKAFFLPPVDLAYGDAAGTMIGTARQFRDIIWENGATELDPRALGTSESEGLVPKGSDMGGQVGFVKVEQTDHGLSASVGSVDRLAKVIYTLPL